MPRAEELHLYAVGILESGSTYDKAYRSAFTYDTASRLPHLRCPALICAGPNDMLVNGVEESRRFNLPNVETILTPTTVWWPIFQKKKEEGRRWLFTMSSSIAEKEKRGGEIYAPFSLGKVGFQHFRILLQLVRRAFHDDIAAAHD